MSDIKTQLELISTLEAAKARIVDPKNWIQNDYTRDAEGKIPARLPTPADNGGVCFCSGGALMTVVAFGTTTYRLAYKSLCAATEEFNNSDIIDYNDSHTHEEVMAAWDKAIELEKNKLIVLNLERLIEAAKDQPEELYDLSYYSKDFGCGTLHCTVGLAATIPEFNLQGYAIQVDPHFNKINIVTVNGEEVTCSHNVDAAFGTDAFSEVFSPRGGSKFDQVYRTGVDEIDATYLYIPGEITDKVLALHRLEEQLAIYKGKV